MSKTNVFENDVLKLYFNGTPIADIADNDATSPMTHLQVSLHTADPGETGDQTTSEVVYTGYARMGVIRTSAGWVVTGNSVSPAANIEFPVSTSAGGTATHIGIGTTATGAGKLMYKGALSVAVACTVGVIPRVTTATTITED
jgi:hypothetical protein